ncbi:MULTISPECIES: YHS domain-containing protein [unclassified Arthrobacter]|uniref:YHS domain-containing protein n=1 Tax=unclassified Arthrobacter TaxID=235627 RepID=UPI0027D7D558|nr:MULTISPECIES: YHS domain-containing protein [unclassified Arthrobacter]
MEKSTGSCCGGHATTDTRSQDLNLTARPEQSADAIAQCPVMAGTPVVKSDAEAKGLYRDYEGQRYWFCCAGCGPAFDADPAKYAYVR